MLDILIVDDDSTAASLIEMLLTMEGFQVGSLENIEEEELIGLLRREPPKLILMDIHLRQVNGLNLLRAVRQMDQPNRIRIIMTSGMDYQSRCALLGADGFLLKPYMPEELVRLVHAKLESKADEVNNPGH